MATDGLLQLFLQEVLDDNDADDAAAVIVVVRRDPER